ncbi:bifunctional 4-hydroxy-2-oxoglutarate aldolase/2-dehydro-3-deoxy-phosphogluconate aldolase [Georgenia yuyongxinii]
MTAPATMTTWFDEAFAGQRLMAILRGFDAARTVRLCERAWDLGITQVEVPVQSPDAVPVLRAAVAAAAERGRRVGAGTVTSVAQLEEVAAAGVSFTVAPGLDADVVRWSRQRDLPHLPGVATPSEVQTALRAGLSWVKIFPAAPLGSPWLSALRGPFPDLKMVATGGMDAGNAAEFLAAGARVVAVGSALGDPAQLDLLAEILAG